MRCLLLIPPFRPSTLSKSTHQRPFHPSMLLNLGSACQTSYLPLFFHYCILRPSIKQGHVLTLWHSSNLSFYTVQSVFVGKRTLSFCVYLHKECFAVRATNKQKANKYWLIYAKNTRYFSQTILILQCMKRIICFLFKEGPYFDLLEALLSALLKLVLFVHMRRQMHSEKLENYPSYFLSFLNSQGSKHLYSKRGSLAITHGIVWQSGQIGFINFAVGSIFFFLDQSLCILGIVLCVGGKM